ARVLSSVTPTPELYTLSLHDALPISVAAREGLTVAQLALAWVLRLPEVTSAIAGARRPEQIHETARAGTVELSGEVQAEIEAIRSEEHTSELQSRENLVCRLLLEKKK